MSEGFLVYRRKAGRLEVLLVHPGGQFWRSKDEGAWRIPKVEPLDGEELPAAASRELLEEAGLRPQGASGAWMGKAKGQDRARLGG